MTEGRPFPDSFTCLECSGTAEAFETLHWECVCRYKCQQCGATGYYVRDRPGTLPNIELQPVGLYGAITDETNTDSTTELPVEWQEAQMADHVPCVDEVIEQRPGLEEDTLRIYNRLEGKPGEWLKIATPVEIEQ